MIIIKMEETTISQIQEDRLFESLAEVISEGVYYVTADHTILFWNKKAESITGYSRLEVTGMPCSIGILQIAGESNCTECGSQCPLAATLLDGETREVEALLHRKGGDSLRTRLRCMPVRDHDGKILGAIEVFSDRSAALESMKELKRLRHEANTDSLTGIGNRRMAELALNQLKLASEQGESLFGVVFFDIDHFKKINDEWGHPAGDLVLKQVAKMVSKALRSEDVFCRWGGEEFVILVPKSTAPFLSEIGERIRLLVQESRLNVAGHNLQITISVGLSLHVPGESAKKTVARADSLMYVSKENGRNRVST